MPARTSTRDTTCGFSDEQFHAALDAIAECGWESRAGQALLEEVGARCRRWAAAVDRRCGRAVGTTDPDELLTGAWLTLHHSAARVRAAESPWAYLWTAVSNAAAVDRTADSLGTYALPRRTLEQARGVAAPLRIGLDIQRFEESILGDAVPRNGCDPVTERWSVALRALLQIIENWGGDRAFWADAIDRAVEVMADARRSYQEIALRRDPYLREVLGLRPAQLTALAALLVGTRRGPRARQSLLLALHRNPSAAATSVVGAVERLAIMLGDELITVPGSSRAAARAEAAP